MKKAKNQRKSPYEQKCTEYVLDLLSIIGGKSYECLRIGCQEQSQESFENIFFKNLSRNPSQDQVEKKGKTGSKIKNLSSPSQELSPRPLSRTT